MNARSPNPTGDFDQSAYWRDRGDGYRREIDTSSPALRELLHRQEQEVAAILQRMPLQGVRSVLEVGCGYGRMTPILRGALPQATRYRCADISRGQLLGARRLLAARGIEPQFVAMDALRPAFRRGHDLVVMVEVLLHFPPEQVGAVVRAMQALADRCFLHIDPFQPFRAPPLTALRGQLRKAARRLAGRHQQTDWLHTYPELYDEERTARVHAEPILDGRQHLFLVEQRSVRGAANHEEEE